MNAAQITPRYAAQVFLVLSLMAGIVSFIGLGDGWNTLARGLFIAFIVLCLFFTASVGEKNAKVL